MFVVLTYPCGAFEENITWSRNAVLCETGCVWFHIDCQDVGSASFQALQDSNVSWHCTICHAVNYHAVSANFLDELILSNRLGPISPIDGSSFSHSTFQSDLTSSPVHTTSPTTPVPRTHRSQQTKPKHSARLVKPLKVLNINLNSIVAHSNDLCSITDSMTPDIIVGVETKIDSTIHLGEILPKQYLENVVRMDRKREGRGVLIAAKDDYICSEVTELHIQCEIAWITWRLLVANHSIVVVITSPTKGTAVA